VEDRACIVEYGAEADELLVDAHAEPAEPCERGVRSVEYGFSARIRSTGFRSIAPHA